MAGKKRKSRPRPTKTRVLQARIPEQLDEELRDRAEQLGLSVSTIVRNVLSHTFELVEGVVTDSAQVGRALQGRAAPPETPSLEMRPTGAPLPMEQANVVIGWQEATLNLNGICEKCNEILPMGSHAAVGVPVRDRPAFLCLECLAALSPQADGGTKTSKKVKKKTQGRQKKDEK